MPGPPQPKDIMKASLSVPVLIEASLPAGAPPISNSLSAFADNIPDLPTPAVPASIPGLPALPAGSAALPQVPNFVKTLQAGLPQGGPRLPQSKSTVGVTVGVEPPVTTAFKIGV